MRLLRWTGGLCLWALVAGAEVPLDLFVAASLPGTGRGDPRPWIQNIQSLALADLDADGDLDVIALARGRSPDNAWDGAALYPDGHPLRAFGTDDPDTLPDSSPNVRAGERGVGSNGPPYVGSDLAWFENDGFGNFTPHFILLGGGPAPIYDARHMEVGDLTNDQRPDIVVWCGDGRWRAGGDPAPGSSGASRVVLFSASQTEEGLSWGMSVVWPTGETVGLPRNFVAGALADMDRDGDLDVVTMEDSPGAEPALTWAEVDETGWPEAAHVVRVGLAPLQRRGISGFVVTDVNGDRRPDLVMAGMGGDGQRLSLYTSQDDLGENFREEVLGEKFEARFVTTGDVDGDGRLDVLAGGGRSPLSLFLQGEERWERLSLPGTEGFASLRAGKLADLNGDGRPEVVAVGVLHGEAARKSARRTSTLRVWVQRPPEEDLVFEPGPVLEAMPMSSSFPGTEDAGSLAVGDLGGDGDLDLVRALEPRPLLVAENVWNLSRRVRVLVRAQRGTTSQTLSEFIGVDPAGRVGSSRGITLR